MLPLELFHQAMSRSYRAAIIDGQLVLADRHRHSVIVTTLSLLANDIPLGIVARHDTEARVGDLVVSLKSARTISEWLGDEISRLLDYLYVIAPNAVRRATEIPSDSLPPEAMQGSTSSATSRFVGQVNIDHPNLGLIEEEVGPISTVDEPGHFVVQMSGEREKSDRTTTSILGLYSWEAAKWILNNLTFVQRPAPRILLIGGVSGGGKTVLSQRLLEMHPTEFVQLRRTTTRPPREGEQNLEDHEYVAADEFEKQAVAREIRFVRKNYGFYYGFSLGDMKSAERSGRTWLLQAGGAVAQMRWLWPGAAIRTVAVVPVLATGSLREDDERRLVKVLRQRILGREPNLDAALLETRILTALEDLPLMQSESDLILENPEGADLGTVYQRLDSFAIEPIDIEVEMRGGHIWINCVQESGAIWPTADREPVEGAFGDDRDTRNRRGTVGRIVDLIEAGIRRVSLSKVRSVVLYQTPTALRIGSEPASDAEIREGLIERFGWKYGGDALWKLRLLTAVDRRTSRREPDVQLLRERERSIERDVAEADTPIGRLAAGRITEAYRKALIYAVLGYGDRELLESVGLYIYGSLAIGWAIVGSDVDYRLFCRPGTEKGRVVEFGKYLRRALSAMGLHPDCPEFTAAIERGEWPRNLLDLTRYDSLRRVTGAEFKLPPRPRRPDVEFAFQILRIRRFRTTAELGAIDPKRDPGGVQDIERILWLSLPSRTDLPSAIASVENQSELADALDYLLALRLVLTWRNRAPLRLDNEGKLFLEDLSSSVPWMGRAEEVLRRYDTHRRAVTEALKREIRRLASELQREAQLLCDTLYDIDGLGLRHEELPENAFRESEAAGILIAGTLRDRTKIRRLYDAEPAWAVLYALARNPDTPAEILDEMARRLRSQADRDIRLMVARNPGTASETLDLLRRDPEDIVARAAEAELIAWAEMRGSQ